MGYAPRSLSREKCGPATSLARKLHLNFPSGTHKFQAVLVEDVGVALNWIQSSALVDLGHDAIEWGIDTPGLDELVEVTCDDNVCMFIRSEDGLDEVLEQQDEHLLENRKGEQRYTPR